MSLLRLELCVENGIYGWLGNKENWTMPVINPVKVISVVVSDCRQQESSSVSLSFSLLEKD